MVVMGIMGIMGVMGVMVTVIQMMHGGGDDAGDAEEGGGGDRRRRRSGRRRSRGNEVETCLSGMTRTRKMMIATQRSRPSYMVTVMARQSVAMPGAGPPLPLPGPLPCAPLS